MSGAPHLGQDWGSYSGRRSEAVRLAFAVLPSAVIQLTKDLTMLPTVLYCSLDNDSTVMKAKMLVCHISGLPSYGSLCDDDFISSQWIVVLEVNRRLRS